MTLSIYVYAYARMIAILTPAMPDISEFVCDLLVRQVTSLSVM